jgi:hypothetical protein
MRRAEIDIPVCVGVTLMSLIDAIGWLARSTVALEARNDGVFRADICAASKKQLDRWLIESDGGRDVAERVQLDVTMRPRTKSDGHGRAMYQPNVESNEINIS